MFSSDLFISASSRSRVAASEIFLPSASRGGSKPKCNASNAGTVKEGAGIVRVKAIRGPGMCGADYPLRVSALGESMPLGYAGEVRAPPGGHPRASLRERPLGSIRHPQVTGSVAPVAVKPAATLACPMVSELERWIAGSVQPAAMRWFGMPVAEIKQISAYSCRGMNGNPRARISEHAFGNALDIASFTLADGRIITVKNGWHGLPEEQGFLRDIQGAACDQFNTVLAPGSNVFHYDHIHVDLMRRRSGDRACNPGPVAGEEIAARAGARYARRGGDPFATGALAGRGRRRSGCTPKVSGASGLCRWPSRVTTARMTTEHRRHSSR